MPWGNEHVIHLQCNEARVKTSVTVGQEKLVLFYSLVPAHGNVFWSARKIQAVFGIFLRPALSYSITASNNSTDTPTKNEANAALQSVQSKISLSDENSNLLVTTMLETERLLQKLVMACRVSITYPRKLLVSYSWTVCCKFILIAVPAGFNSVIVCTSQILTNGRHWVFYHTVRCPMPSNVCQCWAQQHIH